MNHQSDALNTSEPMISLKHHFEMGMILNGMERIASKDARNTWAT